VWVALGDALHELVKIIEQRRRGVVDEKRPAGTGGHYAAQKLLLSAQPQIASATSGSAAGCIRSATATATSNCIRRLHHCNILHNKRLPHVRPTVYLTRILPFV